MGNPNLKQQVRALQLNAEGLFKLLGSKNPDDRLRFWEILKGITTPRELALVNQQLQITSQLVKQAQVSTQALIQSAKAIGGGKKTPSAG